MVEEDVAGQIFGSTADEVDRVSWMLYEFYFLSSLKQKLEEDLHRENDQFRNTPESLLNC